jgi:hypothetical protein
MTAVLFLDRALPASQVCQVEAHMDCCASCRKLLSELVRTSRE